MSAVLPRCFVCLVGAWLVLSTPALADDDKDVKPIATAMTASRDGRFGPFEINRNGVAIRSAEELVALTTKAKLAKETAVQKEMEAELAKLLKVESIDWSKQMVIAAIAEKFDSVKTDGKILRANFFRYKEPITLGLPLAPKIKNHGSGRASRGRGEVRAVEGKGKGITRFASHLTHKRNDHVSAFSTLSCLPRDRRCPSRAAVCGGSP
ncbi:MAG: hypothetical protein K8U57_00910 [Planctomycetes bacterium]|nr:hypothetical protein [Planctomycetota bacterium]